MAKTRERRPKQQHIPGSEPERIKVLDDAAEIYYENDDFKVSLTDTHNVKCKKKKAGGNGDGEED